MSTTTISPLRQRMIEDMTARKFGPASQRSHIESCERFAAHLKRSPATATPDDVRLVMLSPETLGLLREWWKARPTRWDTMVSSQDRGQSVRSLISNNSEHWAPLGAERVRMFRSCPQNFTGEHPPRSFRPGRRLNGGEEDAPDPARRTNWPRGPLFPGVTCRRSPLVG
jgi:hypothetical protein